MDFEPLFQDGRFWAPQDSATDQRRGGQVLAPGGKNHDQRVAVASIEAKVPHCAPEVERPAAPTAGSGRANRRYIVGTTTMFSSVDVVNPQRMTMAIGV